MSRVAPLLIVAFPILLVFWVLTYFLLPDWAELIMVLAVPLYAVLVTLLASRMIGLERSARSRLLIGLVALTWLLWVFLPIKRLGGLARLYIEMPTYEATTFKSEQPLPQLCLTPNSCWPGEFKYISYTSGLFMLPTLGVVRTPRRMSNLDENALQDQLPLVTCEPEPLAEGYFWCSMR